MTASGRGRCPGAGVMAAAILFLGVKQFPALQGYAGTALLSTPSYLEASHVAIENWGDAAVVGESDLYGRRRNQAALRGWQNGKGRAR